MYPANYSAKDTAVTQRPPSSALLCIDSEDRYSDVPSSRVSPTSVSQTPYDFTITKRESLMNGFFTRVGVSEVVFPWVIPNINPKTNRMRVSFNGNPPVQISITPGFYSPSALAAAIQVAVRAVNVALNAFTITYGASGAPLFEYATNNATVVAFYPIVANSPGYSYDLTTTRQLFDVLGFNASNQLETTSYFGGSTYCQAVRYIDIVCSQMTYNQALKDTMSQKIARDVLCRVYVGDAAGVQSTVPVSSATFCPPGCAPTTIYKNFAVPKYIQWMPNQPVPGFLRFEVYDDQGVILTEQDPGAYSAKTDWSMTMLVSEN